MNGERVRTARRSSLFTRVSTVVSTGVLVILVLSVWELFFSAVGAVVYAGWRVVRYRDVSAVWSVPADVGGAVGKVFAVVPGYVWVGLLLVLWLEWRLSRLEHALDVLTRAVRRLRRGRRPRPSATMEASHTADHEGTGG